MFGEDMTSKTISRPFLKKAEDILGEARKDMGLENFPFESNLSMAPLIAHWQKCCDKRRVGDLTDLVEDYVRQHPTILNPYPQVDQLLAEHQAILEVLFSGIFPVVLSENLLGYAAPPFLLQPFYVTDGLRDLLSDKQTHIKFEQFGKFDTVPFSIRACMIILDKYYQMKLDWTLPFLFKITHEGSNMEEYYKTTSVLDYVEVKTKKKAPTISREKVDYLLKHMEDEALWLEAISPEVFYFEGLFMSMMNDVTEVETLSRLRKKLLEPDSLLEESSARVIANLTRMYMRLPNVEVGISALDYPADKSVAHRYKIHYPIVEGLQRMVPEEDKNSVYEQACRLNQLQVVSDLARCKNQSPIEQALVKMGFRSLMVLPLHDAKRNIIGLMELASPEPFVFTHLKVMKLKEILSLYNHALHQARESVENQITSIIQEQYTNIHPSIRWKFTETAFNYLEQREFSQDAVLAPIIFEDIYPLFGQIDINSSTDTRNAAVQADLNKNLELLLTLLDITYDFTKFQLLKKYRYELNTKQEDLQERFDSSEEAAIGNLIVHDIHPLIRQIQRQNPVLTSTIEEYFDQVDAQLDLVYEQRHKYEQSLRSINRTIGSYLQNQEKINQKIIPHYFEKYKTDGIEYTIYLGQSLLQKGKFAQHHLHNLRLWQLKSMVELYHRLETNRPSLAIDMSVSFLIIAFDNPLSIKFLMEEKQFDVHGAYNIQYEVLKKRVDKALILGTTERLTAPDKLAIVFLQEKEKREYLEYINFLVKEQLLQSSVEELELEPVQGMAGVRALRVAF